MLTSVFIQNSCFLFFDGIKAWISEMRLEKTDGRNTVKRNRTLCSKRLSVVRIPSAAPKNLLL